jgi:hypothetical protein
VDDAGLVRHLHRFGQRTQQCGGSAGRLRRAREFLGQAAALDELHGKVRPAFDVTRVEDCNDVRVSQAGQRRGLPVKPLQFLGGGERAREQHLERNRAIERSLSGLVDDAHAAAAQHAQHLVAGDLRQAGGGRHARERAGRRISPKLRKQRHDLRVDELELLPPLPEFRQQFGAVTAHFLRRLA